MARYQITRVHTEPGPGTFSHEHIAAVELSNRSDQRFQRWVIINDLRTTTGDRYYTLGGGQEAEVIVRGCPFCAFNDYITTVPDSTVENNLLYLPRF